MSLIIFTELDEILFPASESERELLATTIQQLQQHQIPLITVSGKTRAEVADWRQKLALDSPFIVERGSGIFFPSNKSNFKTTGTDKGDSYYLYQLGCSYTEARAALKAVQEEINKILRGFGDMDEANIQSLTNSSSAVARQAKAREFSEYFLTPSRLEIEQLQEVAAEYGFKILPGASLSLILGAGADEAKSIDFLRQRYITNRQNIKTVGLGSSEGDLAMLETVDIPVVIPVSAGVPPCYRDKNYQVASNPGMLGWAESIKHICQEYL